MFAIALFSIFRYHILSKCAPDTAYTVKGYANLLLYFLQTKFCPVIFINLSCHRQLLNIYYVSQHNLRKYSPISCKNSRLLLGMSNFSQIKLSHNKK